MNQMSLSQTTCNTKYNSNPSSAPPGFNPNKTSLNRFFETTYKQWRTEQKLDPIDDFIHFHKSFPTQHQKNVFNILQQYKHLGMESAMKEVAKFFAFTEVESYDLQEKFLSHRANKNTSSQDTFNYLFDLQSSINPEYSHEQLVKSVKIQFVRSLRHLGNIPVKNLFMTEMWKDAQRLECVLTVLNQVKVEQGTPHLTLGTKNTLNESVSSETMDTSLNKNNS